MKIFVRGLVPDGEPKEMHKVRKLFSYQGKVYNNAEYYYYYRAADKELEKGAAGWPYDVTDLDSEEKPGLFPGDNNTIAQP